jgi:Leucine-rich repeat (LRR) protein
MEINGAGGQYFIGTLPATFGNFYTLRTLIIKQTKIANLPQTIGRMRDLLSLTIDGNPMMAGTLASAAFQNLTSLRTLRIKNTSLSGQIPATVFSPSSLTFVQLSDSLFTGPLPTLTANSNVQDVIFSRNQIDGTIPGSFSRLSSAIYIELNDNLLTGIDPGFSVSTLQELYLQNNRLTGQLPPLNGFPALIKLNLSTNDLTGTFPAGLGTISTLAELYLTGNRLSGTLPSLAGATSLRTVLFAGNQFCGCFPSNSAVAVSGVCYLEGSSFCCSNNAPIQCSDAWRCENCTCSTASCVYNASKQPPEGYVPPGSTTGSPPATRTSAELVMPHWHQIFALVALYFCLKV